VVLIFVIYLARLDLQLNIAQSLNTVQFVAVSFNLLSSQSCQIIFAVAAVGKIIGDHLFSHLSPLENKLQGEIC